MARETGLEPATSTVTGWYSNQLSYSPAFAALVTTFFKISPFYRFSNRIQQKNRWFSGILSEPATFAGPEGEGRCLEFIFRLLLECGLYCPDYRDMLKTISRWNANAAGLFRSCETCGIRDVTVKVFYLTSHCSWLPLCRLSKIIRISARSGHLIFRSVIPWWFSMFLCFPPYLSGNYKWISHQTT